MKTKVPARPRPVNGAAGDETTRRFKLAPPRPEAEEPTEPTSQTAATYVPPAPAPEFGPVEQLLGWEPAADAVGHEPAVAEPESPEPESFSTVDFQAQSPFDSDDTEVLEELASLLHEISSPAAPPVEPPPSQEPEEPPAPPPPVPMFEPAGPPPVVVQASDDDTEITRRLVPQAPSEPEPERLERLLKFVARQEPGLRWAVGNRDDGTTLLVTDLAHGWIPPGIKLPSDVHLLEPARRQGTATALLGGTTLLATYAPGDPLGWATDYDVTDTSSRPRELPAADDLGWLLNEATHWRDGLPRMVNTLAKAGAAGTGILDAEIDILRVYLDTSRYQLLAQYPDVDAGLFLNCLLLAASEGMATKDQLNANYHFAWFQMLSAPPTSRWKAGP